MTTTATGNTDQFTEIINKLVQMGVDKILWGIAVLFICLLFTHLIMKLVREALKRIPSIDPSLHTILRAFIKFILCFISVTISAGIVGIPVNSLLALFSVVGLAISLAVQGVLTNLAGGIIILSNKMFTLGDYIETDNNVAGTVKEIGILHTKLMTFDGKIVYVPNSLLHSTKLINYTVNDMRRVDISLSASYDNAPSEVRVAVLSAVAGFSHIAESPAPELVVKGYGENAIEYSLRVWVKNEEYWPTYFGVTEAIYKEFKNNHVEMTYPHINVHMKS